MNILFTICGRAGSKGFKNKNLKEMNGVPLVFYTLAAIKLFMDRHDEDSITVALNTDSEPLIKLVENQKGIKDVHFVSREKKLAGDKVAKVDVIRDTYRKLGCNFDIVVDLDITSPLRTVKDIENIINEYESNCNYDLVISVVRARRSPYFNMVEKRDGYFRKICGSNFTTRQEAPESYELNASIYAYRPTFLEINIFDTILDHKCGVSEMKDYLVLDIDSEEDFKMMEFLHQYYITVDEGLSNVYEEAKKFS